MRLRPAISCSPPAPQATTLPPCCRPQSQTIVTPVVPSFSRGISLCSVYVAAKLDTLYQPTLHNSACSMALVFCSSCAEYAYAMPIHTLWPVCLPACLCARLFVCSSVCPLVCLPSVCSIQESICMSADWSLVPFIIVHTKPCTPVTSALYVPNLATNFATACRLWHILDAQVSPRPFPGRTQLPYAAQQTHSSTKTCARATPWHGPPTWAG